MKQLRFPFVFGLLLCGMTLAACGGGGGNSGGGMMGGNLTAAFTPATANPGPNTVSMNAGASTDDTFRVQIRVGDIVNFFGAAFRVSFNAGTAEFQSFDASGSFLQANSPNIDINAAVDPNNAGLVLVNATLQGQVQGIDTSAVADDLLIELTFRATNPTGGNAFTFDGSTTRVITTCPAPPTACSDIPDGSLTWSGGTLTAN